MSTTSRPDTTIAVVIPCYQEATTIGGVVKSFRQELPNARIYVFDNNCTDDTAQIARDAGAEVVREHKQGKGHVVATIFSVVDADVLVMVDGDGTYDASAVHRLIEPILRGDADMTVAARVTLFADKSFRPFHLVGNRVVSTIINRIFKTSISDIFSGYRAFTRECALTIPITSHGFDVETELTVQTLYRGLVIREIEAPYGERPEGSFSKLSTIPDGLGVLLRLFLLLRAYKPLTMFGGLFLLLLTLGLLGGALPVYEALSGGQTNHLGAAIIASILLVLAFVSLSLGLVLSSVNQRLLELERVTVKRIRQIDR